ncbi:hypothetical protein [Helicobacter brantae]|uniref:Periplasmic protein n=1 Tax=Helicobacter brantae TaxID=375927 RepID=A0A3D8IY96_9HELI|nr:hypothetical protein [Helicobacter brantae]RDU70239.1 hypothetical protein CQA58_06410 [Helicobacter brantae]
MVNNKLPAILAFFCLLAGGTIWITLKIRQDKTPITLPQEQTTKEQKSKTQEEWFYAMAKKQNKTYSYPTSEMVMKYDFNRGVEPLRIFVGDLSEYRFYCINQVLLKNNIEYAYYKTDKVIQLIIFLNDKESQTKILSDFDYYNIAYTLQQ